MSLLSELWDEISDIWYAPMFWPMSAAFVIAAEVESWAVLALLMPFLIALIVVGMAVLLPVQILMFAGIFVCALVVAPIHLLLGGGR